jgi:NADPH2 dehydrogenase
VGDGSLSKLFSPWSLKGLTLKNRVVMSPMCQYSVWAEDGKPNSWHYVHYISRAVGGAGLIFFEMTDVLPDGRITVHDLGLWSDEQIPAYAAIVEEIHRYGAKAGIQIAHAGRKAQSESLKPVGPSAIPFSPEYRTPHALTTDEVKAVVDAFAAAARRALRAGFDVIELHGAHGYLLHQFMSPLSNRRDDVYAEPTRFPVEVIQAVKAELPSHMPLFMRLSATEWTPEGYDFPALLEMARAYQKAGVDVFDVSSGGNSPATPPVVYPGYHVPFAAALRRELGMPIAVVGMLENWHLAEHVLQSEEADLILIGRGMLRDPYWANSASVALDRVRLVPEEYARAYPGLKAGA